MYLVNFCYFYQYLGNQQTKVFEKTMDKIKTPIPVN